MEANTLTHTCVLSASQVASIQFSKYISSVAYIQDTRLGAERRGEKWTRYNPSSNVDTDKGANMCSLYKQNFNMLSEICVRDYVTIRTREINMT